MVNLEPRGGTVGSGGVGNLGQVYVEGASMEDGLVERETDGRPSGNRCGACSRPTAGTGIASHVIAHDVGDWRIAVVVLSDVLERICDSAIGDELGECV